MDFRKKIHNLAAMQNVKNQVLIVGSVGIDTIETPKEISKRQLGGSASYASISASYFCQPSIIAIVGSDFEFGNIFIQHKIEHSGLEVVQGKTFFWHGRYHNNFKERDTLITELNVFANFSPRLQPIHAKMPVVLLANIHPRLQKQVLDQMKNKPFVIVDTMNLWIETALDDLEELIMQTDLLVINDEEARQWSGCENLSEAAQTFLNKGLKFVIIKLGPEGAMLFHEAQSEKINAYPVRNLIDPTGAGDTFVGAIAGILAQSKRKNFDSVLSAMKYGSAVASFCVEGLSLRAMQGLQRNEIQKRVSVL